MRRFLILSIAVLSFFALASTASTADVPTSINYQGLLTDKDTGEPLTGTVDLVFSLYSLETGSGPDDPLWSEPHNGVSVNEGLFNIKLGGLDETLFLDPTRWLQITVDGEDITPRIQMVCVPYAYHSKVSDSSEAANAAYAIECDGCITDQQLASNSVHADELAPNAVASENIQNGTIQFEDIGQNDAIEGQVMKRIGSNWVASDDETGASSGWIDDGDIVRLEAIEDSVGIGTAAPTEKLEVDGNLKISGKANLGPGNTNTGTAAFVAGENNSASGNYSTAGGGASNNVAGNYSTVAGGQSNGTGGYYNSIAGGSNNRTSGTYSSIAGGQHNRVMGDYSFTVGFADTVAAVYSYLFGINSNLTQDSTFMVDLPYIRFGNEEDGYQFPVLDGGVSQVLATDGSGQLGWTSVSGTTDADWAISGDDMYSGVEGNVGIGTTSPVTKLEVSSLIRLTPTDDPGTCDGTVNGSIYYDESRGELCYCNGITWMQVDGGGPCSDECPDSDNDGYDICDPSNPNDTDGNPADCDDDDYDINPGAEELCDGIDNNCDNQTDEGNPEGGGSCGPCDDGVLVCIGGSLECVGASEPDLEICDEVDNDCDGQIDEGAPCEGDLIITEIMPLATNSDNDFFEIYNAGSQTINLNGLTVTTDAGSILFTIDYNENLPAGSYFTFASPNAQFEFNYGFDALFTIDNTDDIQLIHGGMVIDQVSWDPTWPFSSGASMVLDDSAFNSTANDNSSNWCTSTSSMETGDYGTPGEPNDDCF